MRNAHKYVIISGLKYGNYICEIIKTFVYTNGYRLLSCSIWVCDKRKNR